MADLRETLNAELSDSYTVERELGGGGMSRVFLATERRLDRRVVIKVLPDEVAAEISSERFRREIQLAARLQHPHIVPVLSSGEVRGKPYFTMPFIEGESLAQRIAREGELPLADAIKLLQHVASALAYAHKQGIVHRDIKPDNVMLTDEFAVVTDFGVAKALNASAVSGTLGTVTAAGVALGTPTYMAPEQALADPSVDHRADIYSFGVLAYEILTGSPPFTGRSTQALVGAHVVEPPDPIERRRPNLPGWLSTLVMRCLEKRPADRPQSAAEMLQILQASEHTTGGSAIPAAPQPLNRRALPAAIGILIVALAVAGYALFARRDGTRAVAPTAIRSVAVLPLVNVGGSAQDDYFSDGMTDELANALNKIPGLRVASRTSAYAFKGRRDVNVGDIGRTLNVQAVLEGTVRRAGDRLRVTGQLTSVSDGLSLWSDSYDREAKDVFAVQDDIAGSIAEALKLRLASTDGAQMGSGFAGPAVERGASGTENLQAYDYYLRGRYFWNARGADNLRRAISYFDQALAADPGFARAYAARAIAYALLPEYTDASPADALEKATADAQRALLLDSTLAEAHTGLALASVHAWDWETAEASYKRAIALDPRYPTAHQWYGELLYNTSRLDSALAETQRAKELDPLAPILAAAHAYALILSRRYSEAIAETRRGLELAPNLGVLNSVAGLAYLYLGDHANARKQMELAVQADPEVTLRQGQLAFVYARTGYRSEALAIMERMKRGGTSEAAHAVAFAIPYLALGETGRALDLLEQAVQKRDIGLLTGASPLDDLAYTPVRHHPRFRRMMEQMNLARFIK